MLECQKARGGIPRHGDLGRHCRRRGDGILRLQALRRQAALTPRRYGSSPASRPRHSPSGSSWSRSVYAIGPISGCHVNPAVTLGFIASGRMKMAEGVGYMVAQVVGAIGGAYLLYWMFTTSPLLQQDKQGLGTDGYGKASLLHISQGGAFLVEVVLTAIFVLVVLFATHKAAIQGAAGVAIGFGLVIVHLIGIPLTGTSVNPARSLGPALVVGGTALSQVWLFIVAPLVGGDPGRGDPSGHRGPVQGRQSVVDRLTGSGPTDHGSPATVGAMELTDALASSGTAGTGSWPPSGPTGGPSCPTSCTCRATTTPCASRSPTAGPRRRNLRRDPRASLYVLGDNFYQYVVLEATAELSPVAADPHDATVGPPGRLLPRGQGEHPDWEEYREAMVGDGRLILDRAPRAGLRLWSPLTRSANRRATPRPAGRGRARAPRPPWRWPARRRPA